MGLPGLLRIHNRKQPGVRREKRDGVLSVAADDERETMNIMFGKSQVSYPTITGENNEI
jgi:hypothetical protein